MAPPSISENMGKVSLVKTEKNHPGISVESYEVDFDPLDIRSIREKIGMTQAEFASTFGLAIGSVRNWEQKRSDQDASIRSYIAFIKNNPQAVIGALEKERRGRRVRVVAH